MPIKFEVELSDGDLDYYRKAIDDAWRRNSGRPQKEILGAVRERLLASPRAETPEYVRKRMSDLRALVSMLEDPDWTPELDDPDRRRILAAVSYFAEPDDMIADHVPGLGFLDDALIVEAVMRELAHEVDGYRQFCEYRENERTLRGSDVGHDDWLAAQRRQVFLRIKRRQQEDRRHRSTEGPTDPILRYQY